MLLKIVVLLLLAIIIYCLGSGLFFLVRDEGKSSTRMIKALTWRIVLSFGLFILLIVAYALGWITPHSVMVPPPQ